MNLDSKTESTFALERRARQCYAAGDIAGAIQAQEQVVKAFPQDGDMRFNLGTFYYEADQLGDALREFREAYHLNHHYMALFNIATVKEETGDVKTAESLYRKVLEMEPGCAQAHFALCRIYAGWQEPRRSIVHLLEYRRLAGPGSTDYDLKRYLMVQTALIALKDSVPQIAYRNPLPRWSRPIEHSEVRFEVIKNAS